jgi:hypothetical protein
VRLVRCDIGVGTVIVLHGEPPLSGTTISEVPQGIQGSVPSGFKDSHIFVPFLIFHFVSNFIQTAAAV